jgi:hypothetical protein
MARLLYSKEQASGGNPIKLQEIQDIGSSLKVALEMAAKCEPGTMGRVWPAGGQRRRWPSWLSCFMERPLPLLQAVEARLLKAKPGY